MLELPTVRTQCLAVSKAPLSFWEVDDTALPAVVDFVLSLIARDYDNEATRIRPHGRWGHFLAAGTDRISPLLAAWREEGTDESEICRRMIDLTLISVLLDAGAGSWEYTEPGSGTKIGRSEGLAVASLHMFKEGIFSSSSSQKHRVDAQGLKAVTHKALMEGLQVSPENPMPGAEGRVELLMR